MLLYYHTILANPTPRGNRGKLVLQEDTMNQDQVVELMKSSKSESEWNANCNKVKKACGGYPEFWYSAIVLSGVAAQTEAGW